MHTGSTPKRDEMIRVRVEPELKSRLEVVARKRRKKPSEFLRDKLWSLVEAEEKAIRK